MKPVCTPHAPLGAFASFDFGPAGAPAGFALPSDAATAQGVVVGCRSGPADAWALLPFFTAPAAGPQPLPKGRFGRFLGWAGDKWMIGPLVFKLVTPFPRETANDNEKDLYAPVICGYLEYDNSHCAEPADLVFGLTGGPQPLADDRLSGFAFGPTHGFATAPHAEVTPHTGSEVFGTPFADLAALRFTVPPQSRRLYPLVLGFHQAGFHYGQWFANLAEVLAHGLAQHSHYLAEADARDAELMRSPLPFDAKANLTHSTRNWLAATRRVSSGPPVDLDPLFVICRPVG